MRASSVGRPTSPDRTRPCPSPEVPAWRPVPSARSPSCRTCPTGSCPLHKLAYNLWWCWNADAVALFRRIDPDLLRAARPQPDPAARRPPTRRGSRSSPTTTASSPTWTASGRRFRRYLDRPDLVRRPVPRTEAGPADRLLLGRVRHPRERPGLLRRPRRAGRRPPEVGQRPRPAARRRRPDVPRGLLPPVPERRRLAAGALPGERLLQPAADPRDRRRTARRSPCRVQLPRPRGARPRLADPGRPRAALPARLPTSRRTRRTTANITAQLYGGDHDMRIQQEIVLGIGGMRALRRSARSRPSAT